MGVPLSDLPASLPRRFTSSDRLQHVPAEASRRLIEAWAVGGDVAQWLSTLGLGPEVSRDTTDGLRLTFAGGDIVHFRPSGNAPELRCYTEADTPSSAEQLCARCLTEVAAALRRETAKAPCEL